MLKFTCMSDKRIKPNGFWLISWTNLFWPSISECKQSDISFLNSLFIFRNVTLFEYVVLPFATLSTPCWTIKPATRSLSFPLMANASSNFSWQQTLFDNTLIVNCLSFHLSIKHSYVALYTYINFDNILFHYLNLWTSYCYTSDCNSHHILQIFY